MKERFWFLDASRGIAVLMMIIFHFVWDLNYLGFAQVLLYDGFWGFFQKLTAGLFLFLVGVGIAVSYQKHEKDFTFHAIKRSAKIFAYAYALTLISFLLFPSQPILFGVLHLIGFSILLGVFFAKKKIGSLALGVLAVSLPLAFDFSMIGFEAFYWLGFADARPALDFFPVIPWISAVFFGAGIGNFLFEKTKPKIVIEKPKNALAGFISFLGKHSLFVYFIHQPILFLGLLAVKIIV